MQSFLMALGSQAIYILVQIGRTVNLIAQAFCRVRHLHVKETINQMYRLGVTSFPIVCLTLLFTGMVMTAQIAHEISRYGAQFTIGGLVTIAMGRELAPVLCGVVLAGRAGAAITAEIGTMRVTEQIDALRCLATDPIAFLVVPRMVACMVMLPLLEVMGLLIGGFGGLLVATLSGEISAYTYLHSIDVFVVPSEVYLGMIKTIFFGMIVAVVGCDRGLYCKAGAEGVGRATMQTVVYSMMMIFAVNYALSAVLY